MVDFARQLRCSFPGFAAFHSSQSPNPMQNPFIIREEPESIRKWRLEHEEQLRRRDEEEAKKKDELRTQATKELEEW